MQVARSPHRQFRSEPARRATGGIGGDVARRAARVDGGKAVHTPRRGVAACERVNLKRALTPRRPRGVRDATR